LARIYPFAALRYDQQKVGRLENVVTQPYDKITAEMLERYRALSPYNLAHVIKNSNYAEAAGLLRKWLREGILRRDPVPAIYPYFQTYGVPGSGETRARRGFIAAGGLEDYAASVVFRHERTLAGPKRDRLQLLRATRAHFGQIFMLYSGSTGEIDALLEAATATEPIERVCDEYGAEHVVWRVDEPARTEAFSRAMSGSRLIIADGHHRYETALAFRDECRASSIHQAGPAQAGMERARPGRFGAGERPALHSEAVMMTFVNMDDPGLTILPAHRVLARLPGFDGAGFLGAVGRYFAVSPMGREEIQARLPSYQAGRAIGCALAGTAGPDYYLLVLRAETDLEALLPGFSAQERRLDVVVLHQLLLPRCLGIDEEAVREEKFLEYAREFAKGAEAVAQGAPACFFLNPVRVAQMCEIAFAGGVLPQKSTDFYPKLLSGLTGYEVAD
jgi:uncharacterized protein (DUF1015 family)